MSLRVITGLRKGHKLKGPNSSFARPTEDRIKESIFNIINTIEDDAVCLDLFAATGNIGIEFLSRGAKKAYFSEKDRDNIENMQWNIEHTKFTDQAVILEGDFRRNLLKINEKVDYVFIDPPYKTDFYTEALEIMLKKDNFNDALFITEMNRDDNFEEVFDALELMYGKKYGKKYVKFYRRRNESSISR